MIFKLPPEACGLRLARIKTNGELVLCEAVRFVEGMKAVDTTLHRASLAGLVEVDGNIQNHFADVLDTEGDLIVTVALDAKSYASLKNRWMRCKVENCP